MKYAIDGTAGHCNKPETFQTCKFRPTSERSLK